MKRSNWSTRSWSLARPTAIGPQPGGVATSKRSSRLRDGDIGRAHDLAEGLVQSCAQRGVRLGQCWAWQVRGLAALGNGDFEEAYQQASMISPPGHLAPHNPHAVRVLLDLVEAAVRSGRDAEAAAHVAAMRETNVAALSSHLALVVGGSAAMAAPDDTTVGAVPSGACAPRNWAVAVRPCASPAGLRRTSATSPENGGSAQGSSMPR